MFSDASTRGLIWKETRQIFPLIAMVLAVGLFLLVVGLIVEAISVDYASLGSVIPWLLPACYAAGAAALLVGHEKEQKTIWWLATLPAPPMRLIGTKLVVASIGLLFMWGVSGLMTMVTGSGFHRPLVNTSISSPGAFEPTFVLQSILVLVCGFYAAWRMQSTFGGLMLLIPLACGPFLCQQLFHWVYRWFTGSRQISAEISDLSFYGFTITGIVIFTTLATRAAKSELAPQTSRTPAEFDSPRRLGAWRPTVTPVSTEPFRHSISGFLWQSIQPQRMVLAVMSGMILLGGFCLAWSGSSELSAEYLSNNSGWFVLAIAIAATMISWLGVMAFAGDGSVAKLRFLADRGVSPGKAWLGRQSTGICVLSIAILAYFLFSWWALSTSGQTNTILSVALVAVCIWSIYSVSQWVSQSIPILAGSVIIAPLVSAVTLVWAGYAASLLEAPLWWLLALSLLPIVATRLLMHRYMDGRRGWLFIGTIVGVALTLAIGPAVPFAIDIVRTPDISDQVKRSLLAEASQIDPINSRWSVMRRSVTGVGSRSPEFASGEELLQSYESAQYGPRNELTWPEQDPTVPQAMTIDQFVHYSILRKATHARINFENSLLEPTEDNRAAAELGDWITAIADLAQGLRLSHMLADQEFADLLEIWLVDTLQDESIRTSLEIDMETVIRVLGDAEQRNRSRHEAVLASWLATRSWKWTDDNMPTLGGVNTIQWFARQPPLKQMLTYHRHTNQVVASLIGLIEAGEKGESTTNERTALQKLIEGTAWDSNWGSYTDHFREHVTLTDLYSHKYSPSVGSLWYARWEDQAEEIALKLENRSAASDADKQE